jgi:23S rRNA (adenine2503-C2)-methyltransferase
VTLMESINDLTRGEMREALTHLGQPAYRATQICEWLHRRRAMSFDDMTNLPLALRKDLQKHFEITRVTKLEEAVSEDDGTAKYVLKLGDGNLIESVFLPHPRGATLCISTQVGCAFRCRFCATGGMGLKRDLSSGEIVDQVSFFKEYLPLEDDAPRSDTARAFSNLVFMGMGEPLANYENLIRAITILTKEVGIGSRRMTVSTCGLPDKIMRLAKEPYEVSLAISLNSPFDQGRRELMPVAGKTPLSELMSAARYYFAKRNRTVTFEYVLISDVNDHVRDAHALAGLLRDIPAKVNLIALNPFPGCRYRTPERVRVRKFLAVLRERGKKVTLRKSKGCDILAACGQLGAGKRKRG